MRISSEGSWVPWKWGQESWHGVLWWIWLSCPGLLWCALPSGWVLGNSWRRWWSSCIPGGRSDSTTYSGYFAGIWENQVAVGVRENCNPLQIKVYHQNNQVHEKSTSWPLTGEKYPALELVSHRQDAKVGNSEENYVERSSNSRKLSSLSTTKINWRVSVLKHCFLIR